MKNGQTRRKFLVQTASIIAGTVAANGLSNKSLAAMSPIQHELLLAENTVFTLPQLPYAFDALEPYIDKMTMEIHYTKHHQAYIINLNKALETLDPKLVDNKTTLENLLANCSKLPAAIRNNAGGHYNHSLFWTLMKANANAAPSGPLLKDIESTFGSMDAFKTRFSDVAMKRFGSGWAWLIQSDKGKLSIMSTANQDNPMMDIDSVESKGKPILALDVWEHAYYLKNQNRRIEYINAWWKVVNWETAEKLYTTAKK